MSNASFPVKLNDSMPDPQYTISDGQLIVLGRKFATEFPVKRVCCVDDRFVALLDVPSGVIENRNVACFNFAGELLWRIQQSKHGGTDDNPYASIQVTDERDLVVQNWHGVEYRVDLDDGTVSESGFRRF